MKNNNKKIIVSGIQPTGRIHLGNYLGSITNFIKMQNDNELFIFIADLHSITVDFIPNEIHKNRLNLIQFFLASGLDPKKTCIFTQSDINEHAVLSYILLCHTSLGELERMTQYKNKINELDKQKNNTLKIPTGLLTYPTLMAADILLYQAEGVPVGLDQKQHLELTRNLAIRFNKKYGKTFTIPEPIIQEINNKIMDLNDPTKKMSKSSKNLKGTIFLDDSINEIINKIKSAKTDSYNQIKYDIKKQPNISNLITIYIGCINDNLNKKNRKKMFNKNNNITIQDIENKYINSNYQSFKNDLIIVVVALIKQIQERKKLFEDDLNLLNKILNNGKEKAQLIASKTLKNVYEKIGFKKIK